MCPELLIFSRKFRDPESYVQCVWQSGSSGFCCSKSSPRLQWLNTPKITSYSLIHCVPHSLQEPVITGIIYVLCDSWGGFMGAGLFQCKLEDQPNPRCLHVSPSQSNTRRDMAPLLISLVRAVHKAHVATCSPRCEPTMVLRGRTSTQLATPSPY